ncbi:MAG: glycosyltransferase N-terminal domain-containing protein [Bacteroidota bacterium]
MSWLYRLGIGLYHSIIRLLALLGKPKAKAWVEGRQLAIDWDKLDQVRSRGPVVWLHAASLGEFEQGRPVLDLIRQEMAGRVVIVLSFYSPSGFRPGQKYEGADLVTYLPADGRSRARQWIQQLRPDLAIFVKYEFWHYHLLALTKAQVPTYLIAAAFRADQFFFRPWGGWWRRILHRFQGILLQTEADLDLLLQVGLAENRLTVTGDPRIDRTLELANTNWSDPILEQFSQDDRPLLIAGSVWPPDIERLLKIWPEMRQQWRLLLVPHQLEENELQTWALAFKADRYSKLQPALELGGDVMILDTIGILSRCYRYGKLAYIGGGFGSGIHNSLEPMAYGLPVLFGPKIQKFAEAVRMAKVGGAKVIKSAEDLQQQLQWWSIEEEYALAQEQVQKFMQENKGASLRTWEVLCPVLQQD